jgi:hypothetical protein
MRRAPARLLFAALCTCTLALPTAAAARGSFLERNPSAQITLRAGAAAPSLVTGLDLPVPAGDPAEAIRALLVEDADFFGFDPILSDLEAKATRTAGPFTVYRFAQTHLGLRSSGPTSP